MIFIPDAIFAKYPHDAYYCYDHDMKKNFPTYDKPNQGLFDVYHMKFSIPVDEDLLSPEAFTIDNASTLIILLDEFAIHWSQHFICVLIIDAKLVLASSSFSVPKRYTFDVLFGVNSKKRLAHIPGCLSFLSDMYLFSDIEALLFESVRPENVAAKEHYFNQLC